MGKIITFSSMQRNFLLQHQTKFKNWNWYVSLNRRKILKNGDVTTVTLTSKSGSHRENPDILAAVRPGHLRLTEPFVSYTAQNIYIHIHWFCYQTPNCNAVSALKPAIHTPTYYKEIFQLSYFVAYWCPWKHKLSNSNSHAHAHTHHAHTT